MRELGKWLMLPQAGSDPGPVTPWGMVALVLHGALLLAREQSKAGHPDLCPQEMHRSGGELNTAKSQ